MPNDEHYRMLEAMFHAAPCNQYYQPRMTVEKGRSTITMELRPEFNHGGGSLHGSAYFKLLDDACYFAVASLVNDVFILTASFNIHILRPMRGGVARAEGEVFLVSPRLFMAQGAIYDQEGRETARGSGNFVRSGKALSREMGYLLEPGAREGE